MWTRKSYLPASSTNELKMNVVFVAAKRTKLNLPKHLEHDNDSIKCKKRKKKKEKKCEAKSDLKCAFPFIVVVSLSIVLVLLHIPDKIPDDGSGWAAITFSVCSVNTSRWKKRRWKLCSVSSVSGAALVYNEIISYLCWNQNAICVYLPNEYTLWEVEASRIKFFFSIKELRRGNRLEARNDGKKLKKCSEFWSIVKAIPLSTKENFQWESANRISFKNNFANQSIRMKLRPLEALQSKSFNIVLPPSARKRNGTIYLINFDSLRRHFAVSWFHAVHAKASNDKR